MGGLRLPTDRENIEGRDTCLVVIVASQLVGGDLLPETAEETCVADREGQLRLHTARLQTPLPFFPFSAIAQQPRRPSNLEVPASLRQHLQPLQTAHPTLFDFFFFFFLKQSEVRAIPTIPQRQQSGLLATFATLQHSISIPPPLQSVVSDLRRSGVR